MNETEIKNMIASLKKEANEIQEKIDRLTKLAGISSSNELPEFKNAVYKLFPINRKIPIEFNDMNEFWNKIVEIVNEKNLIIAMSGSWWSEEKKEWKENSVFIYRKDIIENEHESKIKFFNYFLKIKNIFEYELLEVCIINKNNKINSELKIENDFILKVEKEMKEAYKRDQIFDPEGKYSNIPMLTR